MNRLDSIWNNISRELMGKTAILEQGERLSYGQLSESIRRLMSTLILRWHLQGGTGVALLLPNCSAFVISYFAVVSSGGVVQPIDERLTPQEIKATLLDSGARFLIVHRTLWHKIEKIRGEIPAFIGILGVGFVPETGESFEVWQAEPAELVPMRNIAPDHGAELMYTSGTTGEPKGVMRTHANVVAAARNAIRGFGYRETDRIAIVMPLSHSSALNSQMIPLLTLGGTVVLVNRFDVRHLFSVIENEQVTCMRTVPTMMRMLLASPNFQAEALPSLRLLINSSAPIDRETYREVKRRFPSIEVMNSYGLTEASTCTILPDDMALTDPESIGRPIDGVEMCVRDEQGEMLGPEDEGEFYVRGDHVFAGYHNRPEATRQALIGGWLRTGDLGHRDRRGLHYLHGRKNDVINCGGRKFAPADVESCILQMSEILEVAVIAAPHRILGEVAKAFVVLPGRNGVEAKHIIQHCGRHLPSYKIPFSVIFVSELPKNSTGKLLHRKLREV